MKLVVYLYLSMIVLGVQVSVGLRNIIIIIYYFAILIFLIFLARKNFFKSQYYSEIY